MSTSSSSSLLRLCFIIAFLLLHVRCSTALNVNFRSNSFARSLNPHDYVMDPKQLPSEHVMAHKYTDLFILGGTRKGLLARIDYEGDYNENGEANKNKNGVLIPSSPKH
ncbi:hypothetical protein KP509_13G036400 [Ceratopteris richardii]|uniref:Uncharacterized protein n=1 Tax=Ceratopteris richardii TaxID=49495 RepID=A0A8T2TCS0_CERRI|nr:hypothetical protein KP509_13G036400 [Ceratopteris richardii]